VVKVFAFVEFLELQIPGFRLCHVGSNGQVFLVFFSNKVLEFLFYLNLCEPFL
jgi:hypothetical protein